MSQIPDPTTRRQIKVVGAGQTPESGVPRRMTVVDQDIVHRLNVACEQSQTMEGLLTQMTRLVLEQSECLSLWSCHRNERGEFGSVQVLNSNDDPLWPLVQDQVQTMIQRVDQTKQICSSPVAVNPQTHIVTAPVCEENLTSDSAGIRMVLIGVFSTTNESLLRIQWLMGLVTQAIGRWHRLQNVTQLDSMSRRLRDTLGLVQSLDQTSTIPEVSLVVTNHLRRILDAEQVAISFCDPTGHSKLTSISDVERIDLSCEANKLIANANHQTLIAKQPLHYPSDSSNAAAQLALEKYCKANAIDSCLNIPLTTDDQRTIGSVLIGTSDNKTNDQQYRRYVNQVIQGVSGHLDVVLRANRGTRDVLRSSWKRVRSRNWVRALTLGLGLAIAAMFTPLPYRVACDCELQPVMRRFIAAPYQGILEQTMVENGDVIDSMDVVARLDGRQLRMEISAIRAELDGAQKRRDSALAQGDVAVSQIAKSEMRRYRSKMAIIEQHLENLDIRSPIRGIVVSGDLDKVEGAPVEMGQTLFEVAPLNEMLAEIGIPESEIQYVRTGMEVELKLNAFPFKTWQGTVERIHPSAEIKDETWVFVAEVKLENPDGQLRPGMQGTAKIQSDPAPLGWNLFHRSWESVRYWMIW